MWHRGGCFTFVCGSRRLRNSVDFSCLTLLYAYFKFHPFCKISNHHYHRDENDLFLVFESVQYFTEEVWASKIERNHISQYPVLSFLPFLILPSFYCSSSFPFCFLESSIFISLHNKEQHGPSSWVSCPSYNPTHQNQYL